MSRNKAIFNPNYLYVIVFIVPFLVYTLNWSTLYPVISNDLIYFYIFSFVIFIIAGIITNKLRPIRYLPITEDKFNKTAISVLYGLYIIEIIFSRRIPLISLLLGNFEYGDSFGIPFLHTFLIAFNSFYVLYIFHQYLSQKKRRLLFQTIFLVLPFLIFVYRSSLMSAILGMAFIYLLKTNIKLKTIIGSAIVILMVFYGFGYLGNLRSGNGDPTYIIKASGGTSEFLDSPIPNEFYWTYLYVASPVANLQNNINYVRRPEGTWFDVFQYELLPTFVPKLLPGFNLKEQSFHQINEFLNVGTIYVYSFSYRRWSGIILMLIYFFIVINLFYYWIYKSSKYRIVGLAVLFNIITFANFHNTISYSADSLQLIYPVLFSLISRIKI